ncbi:MAG: haloacid dehalogenase type II [Desulfobacterales bacterium]
MPKPAGIVYDAYGTLFDVHSAIGSWRSRLGDGADDISAMWRAKQLEYTWLRSLMGLHADFYTVTAEALDYAFEAAGIEDPALKQELLAAYLQLSAYPEVRDCLETLREAGCPGVILSNGTPEMLASAVRHAAIENLIDAALSVEEVGIYKPHPSVYELARRHFSADAQDLLFVSANAWDIAGAANFGFRTAWVNRFGQKPERLPGRADVELQAIDELLSTLDLTERRST